MTRFLVQSRVSLRNQYKIWSKQHNGKARLVHKQLPLNSRRNSGPVKRKNGSRLMFHEIVMGLVWWGIRYGN